MFVMNKLCRFFFKINYMYKLSSAPNIFAKWYIEKFRHGTSLPLFLQVSFYHWLLMSKFIKNILTWFCEYSCTSNII